MTSKIPDIFDKVACRSPQLLQRLGMMGIRNADHSRALIKEKLTADPDSEISKRLRVSLMCPLGQMRLTVPCRAVKCSHLQCFDAAFYLQMNEKKPTWKCPVCGENAAFKSLLIDGLFMDILNECSDADQIEFQEDGRWCPIRAESHEPLVEVSSQPSSSSDDSSSSDEEPDPPVKISVALAQHATAEPGEAGKKVGVSDLASETASSSSETASEEEEEEKTDPPTKKRCLDKEIHSKGVPNSQASDLPSSLSDQSSLATIPANMQRTHIAGMVHQSVLTTEDFKVPDKMVGFIIGIGGERISRIRLESGCKINIAKTGETIDRPCTLTGTPENIEKAKRLLKDSMEQYRPLLSEQKILIPANKVGLVIGKGGETIKKLEERTGVKMSFLKHKLPAGADKPLRLRIIGDHCKVQQAQELVVKLIQDQEQTDFRAGRGDVVPKMGGSTLDERDGVGGLLGRRGQNDTNMAGPGTVQEVTYTVPADKCGLVIGKETRGTIDKPCNLTGTPENIEKAKRLLKDTKEQYQPLLEHEDWARNDMDGSSMQHILIPADKLGLVIGKGGETIKKLQERTGVKMKMFMDQRDQLPAGADGLLRITGDPCKVQQAQELVVKLIQDQEQTYFRAGRGDVVPKMGGSTLDERDGVGGLLGRRGQNDTNMAGPGTVQEVAYTVPADKCGLVINKGMEVEDGEEGGGMKDKQKKRKKTCKKKESAVERDGVGGLLGRRGQNDTNMAGPGTVQEVAYTVPADKCGLVINKGIELEDGEEGGGMKDKPKKRKKTCKKKESAVTQTKTKGLR